MYLFQIFLYLVFILQQQQIPRVQSNVVLGHSSELLAADKLYTAFSIVKYTILGMAQSLVHLLQSWYFFPSELNPLSFRADILLLWIV